jgi:hypothetical protein
MLSLLFVAWVGRAHAGTLQVPADEDVAAWRVAAAAAGVTVVPDDAQLVLVREGERWHLRWAQDESTRFPIPPPVTPERRAIVASFAAQLLSASPPPAWEMRAEERFDDAADVIAVPPPTATAAPPLPAAEVAALDADAEPPNAAAAPADRGPPRPAPRPVGWVAGLQAGGGAFVNGEPRLTLGLSGGARPTHALSAGLLIAVDYPRADDWNSLTIQRASARAELGLHGVVMGAGLAGAAITANGNVRGELLFPVFELEYEYPFRAGPVWLLPRAGAQVVAANILLEADDGSAILAPPLLRRHAARRARAGGGPMMLVLVLGCPYAVDLDDTGVRTVARPRLALTPEALDFGEVDIGEWRSLSATVSNTGGEPMALELGAVGTDRSAFCVHWDMATASCGESTRAAAKSDTGAPGADTARGWGDSGSGSGSPPGTCADGEVAADGPLVLEPGCTIDAVAVFSPTLTGAQVAGMRVAVEVDPETWAGPPLARDPRNGVQHVRLDGMGAPVATAQRLALSPGTLELPWRWPDGGTDRTTVDLVNPGDLPLTLDTLDASDCPGLAVTAEPGAGAVPVAGDRATVELAYTPTTTAALACTLRASTAEGVGASARLHTTIPCPGEPPTVAITAPTFAERIASTDALAVTIRVADASQPPSSLYVSVETLATGAALVGTPADDSGQASFVLPVGSLVAGPETVVVRVSDLQGNVTTAAVPVRVDDEPVDDADGDAWGLAEGDCDDGAVATFPGAPESPDGADNDCDRLVDAEDSAACEDRLSVAYIDVTPDACAAGELVQLELVALGAATVQWGSDDAAGTAAFGVTGPTTATWRRAEPGERGGERITVYALALDAEGYQSWVDAGVEAHADTGDLGATYTIGEPVVQTTACNPTGAAAAACVFGLGALSAVWGRRSVAPARRPAGPTCPPPQTE